MKKEMSILHQLTEEGKITHHDAGEMIRAMDQAERQSVWEEEGEFDPRRFRANLSQSYSQTMLNDIIWLERSKCNKRLKDNLRSLAGTEREDFLEKIRNLSPADPDQFAENSLMENIDYLRHQDMLDALCVLATFKHLDDFSDCAALEQFDLNRSKEILLNAAQQKRAAEEFRLSLPMREGDAIRLHGQNSVEIYQAEGEELEVIGEKICWADTEEEARKTLKDLEVWTFFEGNRIWIRDSRIHNLLGWPTVNLKLFVPKGVMIKNVPGSPNVAGFCDSVLIKDVEASVTVTTVHSFAAENVTGNLYVDAQAGDVNIVNLNGKAEIEALSGDVSIEDSRADLEIRSVLGDVTCASLSGTCKAKLIHGSLTMTDTCTSGLTLSTKGGKIAFDGVVMGGMGYELKSESGNIELSLDDRSDCGFTAESEEGSVTYVVISEDGEEIELPKEEEDAIRINPNSININFRRGSGSMSVMSKSGDIAVKGKIRDSVLEKGKGSSE